MSQPFESPSPRARTKRFIRTIATNTILAGLLYFALRHAPFAEIWEALKNLKLWQIGFILLINILVVACISARWWIIVRSENPSVPFLPMIGYRLSAFGVSYFTFGPQVGGEPLQVIYLQRNHGLTLARATSAVIIDKLLEFLANFVLIGMGAWAIVRAGLISGGDGKFALSLMGLVLLVLIPLAYLALLARGTNPLSQLLIRQRFIERNHRAVRALILAERMASAFFRTHIRFMLFAILVSFASIAGIAFEYFLMVRFLGMQISAVQIFAALTAMQIAFLMPLPGGLGALEASQVLALGAFGQPASAAISLVLLMRARDILNGGIGLLLAGRGVTK